MWGRAPQIVVTVIALVLARPEHALHVRSIAPFVTSGRAFPTYPAPQTASEASRSLAHRSLQTYVRQSGHRFVAPAERTAVIVGINHARGTPPLPGSVRDARNLHEALVRYGFRAENITLLLEGEATRSAILGALRSLADRTPASGVAVVAIATHTKRVHGTNLLATADGSRISGGELASHLRGVRSPAWIALPTCYAGGYALPGIVGFNRIATFASSADRMSYQAGDAGSFLFIHMVRRAMVEGLSPASVESAFEFARRELTRDHPEHVPSMSDGVPGDLVLGPIRVTRSTRWQPSGGRDHPDSSETAGSQRAEAPPTPPPGRRTGDVGICGRFRYNW